MGRWTIFVDNHEEGEKKKITLEINGYEREREREFERFKGLWSKVMDDLLDFEPNNSLD